MSQCLLKNGNYKFFYLLSVLENISFLENNYLNQDQYDIFSILNYNIKRRIFSPIITTGYLSSLEEGEINIVFNQLKKKFLFKDYSRFITESDVTSLSLLLYEIILRSLPNSDGPKNELYSNEIVKELVIIIVYYFIIA